MPSAEQSRGAEQQLEAHPIADRYPLLEGEDFEAFKASTAANGQRVPIVLYQGKILDGRNRYRACRELGLLPEATDCGCQMDEQATTLADVLNLDRRHLTREQKRAVIAYKLTQNPGQSDRSIAAEVNVSPTTVSTVRKTLSADIKATGVQVGHLATAEAAGGSREGRDGKKYTMKSKGDKPVLQLEAIATAAPQDAPGLGTLVPKQPVWFAEQLSTEIDTLFRLMDPLWPQLHDQFIDLESGKAMWVARRDEMIADAKRAMERVGWTADWLSAAVIPDWQMKQAALRIAEMRKK